MVKETQNKLRIKLANLVPRDENVTDEKLEQILKRIAGQEDAPCLRAAIFLSPTLYGIMK